ncbi:MAG: polyprenyl synthetase family protein [Tissierellia bacterium]|nr:polyprenyl synthetase family protein [Tissierellia bacterium]
MINKYKQLVEGALLDYMGGLRAAQHTILEDAMKYAVLSGGKRLRPSLLLMSYGMYANEVKSALPYAIGIELIHTYSLVHDDLPAMDNDDYRRGLQTVHKKFDEATAILAGDALLTQAFQCMLEDAAKAEGVRDLQSKIEAMKVISLRAGLQGMITGQMIDMEQARLTLEDLEFMYSRKTSDLFAAALQGGAILGGASGDELNLIGRFADTLGMAFQIRDDLQDYHRDSVMGKQTIAVEVGRDEAEILMREMWQRGMDILETLQGDYGLKTQQLREVLDFIVGENISPK